MVRTGRPPKYRSDLEAKKARNLQHKEYMVSAYEHIQEYVPKGTKQRIIDACAFEGMSKRQYIISAIENRLDLTERLRRNT